MTKLADIGLFENLMNSACCNGLPASFRDESNDPYSTPNQDGVAGVQGVSGNPAVPVVQGNQSITIRDRPRIPVRPSDPPMKPDGGVPPKEYRQWRRQKDAWASGQELLDTEDWVRSRFPSDLGALSPKAQAQIIQAIVTKLRGNGLISAWSGGDVFGTGSEG